MKSAFYDYRVGGDMHYQKRKLVNTLLFLFIAYLIIEIVVDFLTADQNLLSDKKTFVIIRSLLFVLMYGFLIFQFFKKSSKTELALLISKERYHDLFEATLDIIFTIAPNGIITSLNKAFEEATGFSREEWLGKAFVDLIAAAERAKVQELLDKILSEKRSVKFEVQLLSIVIDNFICEVTLTLPDYGKETFELIGIARNITERKKAEQDLAAQKERLAVTLRSIGDGVIATDIIGRIVLINPVAERLTGWKHEESLGKPLTAVFKFVNSNNKPCLNPVERVLESGESVGLTKNTVLVSKDGHERYISSNGAPIRNTDGRIIGVVLVFRDISERRKNEEEMLKTQKLESIGLLAGGIAHDFNNILAGVLANTQLAKMMLTNGKDVTKYLEGIEEAVNRATGLTRQLLTFSKGGAPIKKTASIAELIQATVDFTLRGSNVKCKLSIREDLWSAEVDPGQMSQVINNLIINAYQAMPDGGLIFVSAENMVIENEDAAIPKGKYVKIIIEDQGVGIAEEHLPLIFDPYFTTKENGSGLGLATSYSIIKKHDGYIEVNSELGRGTTFAIILPASEKHDVDYLPKSQLIQKGQGKILIMDDDDMVREVAGEMLSVLGYEVEYAKDGNEVLQYFMDSKQAGKPFDAIIMDLTVPGGMGGKSTMEKLISIEPNIKVIVSSGYSNNPVMAEYQKYGFSGVVAKPYKIEELSQTLYQVLQADSQCKIS